jgi:hypothetical protein
MKEDILKGNFKVKRPVVTQSEDADKKESIAEQLRKRALASLGGSMVYVDRNHLTWNGDE